MNAIVKISSNTKIQTDNQAGLLAQLIAEYNVKKEQIITSHKYLNSDAFKNSLYYFLASSDPEGLISTRMSLNSVDTAISHLDAEYWTTTLHKTDIYEYMPQERKAEWKANIQALKIPPFDAQTVYNTMRDLLAQRPYFQAERVDSVFKNLSGSHVTNTPEGFNKRMIMVYSYTPDNVDSTRAGYINDLRSVVAKLMGRDQPTEYDTRKIISLCMKKYGDWHHIDGGALKIRVYKKGTAHLEVHPDLAWRLNEILSLLYPLAIPPVFRKRTNQPTKQFDLSQVLIPNEVLGVIAEMTEVWGRQHNENRPSEIVPVRIQNCFKLKRSDIGRDLLHKVEGVLMACGAVQVKNGYQFDYDFTPVKSHLLMTGTIPEKKCHQYYPTEDEFARELVALCEIEEHHECLEPQAGQGGIAKHMPLNTCCVEISKLHCEILKISGRKTINADFLDWAKTAPKFDRICMNPPYSEGRAKLHLEAAALLLKKGGILTAILPSGSEKLPKLEGYIYNWGKPQANRFVCTAVSVVTLKLVKV